MRSTSEVRSDWPVRRLRYLARINPVRSEVRGLPPTTEVSFVPMDAIGEYGGIRLDETRAIESVSGGYTYFRDGDVLVAKITPCFENGKGAIAAGLEKGVGFGTTELHVLRPLDGVDSRFLFYITISKPFRDAGTAAMIGAAGQKRVPEEFIQNFRVAVPALNDQRTIADFLDEKTAAIDALIAKKERLIELIEERFRAALQRVITKGLDPSVAKADSKLPWLGEIPAHWELRRLKYVADFINGAAFKPTDWQSDGIPIIRIQNLNGGEDFNYSGEELPEKYHVRKGDLLFGWSGNRGTSFGPFLWSREGLHYLNQHIFRVTGFSVDKDWLYWALKEVTHEIEQRAHGIIGMVHITRPELDNTFVPVPPMNEQKAIAAHLQAVSGAMRTVIDKEVSIISRLREYRQTLISAAVTGQLDVRSRTARALDPTAPEPLEEVLT